ARAWIEIGDFRLQPSEFSKLATSLVLARYLSGYGKKITDFSTLFRASIVILLPILLIILQNDTGSALVYGAFLLVFYRLGMSGWVLVAVVYTVFVFSFSIIYNSWFVSLGVMLLAYGVYWYHARTNKFSSLYMYGIIAVFIIPWAIQQYFELQLPEFMPFAIGLVLLLVPAIMYIYKKKSKIIFLTYFLTVASLGFTYSVDYIFHDVLGAHQQSRIRVFFGLESDPKGLEFNVIQSKIAIGSGDFLGKGFLQGTQTKNNFVPEQSTDFIFCTVGEEWGFVGSTIVILSMLLLILRIMFLAEKQRSQFSRIYGYCVASILFFHFLVNIGMTIGLMPVIGIPLPFFSYGGSSLWGFTMLLFIFIKLDSDRDVLIQ
nr:rod shape-determining protein RodA [Bacteroidales bacterium]